MSTRVPVDVEQRRLTDRHTRVKPKSRSMLVVPLARPARWFGTVFTATGVTVEMVTASVACAAAGR